MLTLIYCKTIAQSAFGKKQEIVGENEGQINLGHHDLNLEVKSELKSSAKRNTRVGKIFIQTLLAESGGERRKENKYKPGQNACIGLCFVMV